MPRCWGPNYSSRCNRSCREKLHQINEINRSNPCKIPHLTHRSNDRVLFIAVFSRCLMVSDSRGCLPHRTLTTTVRRCLPQERRMSGSRCRALRFPANCALSHAFGPCGRETAQIGAGLGPQMESVSTPGRRARYHRVLTYLSAAAPSRQQGAADALSPY